MVRKKRNYLRMPKRRHVIKKRTEHIRQPSPEEQMEKKMKELGRILKAMPGSAAFMAPALIPVPRAGFIQAPQPGPLYSGNSLYRSMQWHFRDGNQYGKPPFYVQYP